MTASLVVVLFAVTLGAGLVVYVLSDLLERIDQARLHTALAVIVVAYATALWYRPPSLIVSNTVVLGLAIAAATAIGRRFREAQSIIAFSIAASIADIISFTVGPTRSILENAERTSGSFISYLALSIPRLEGIVPVVGVGDLLVLGVYFVALKQVGATALWRLPIPTAGLLVALGVGLMTGGAFGIPFMALAAIAYLLLS